MPHHTDLAQLPLATTHVVFGRSSIHFLRRSSVPLRRWYVVKVSLDFTREVTLYEKRKEKNLH